DGTWERLLRAFSQFKKWQQSGLQLVLTGPVDIDDQEDFREKLDAYKYRKDVAWLSDAGTDEKKQLASAAFALLVSDNSFAARLGLLKAFRASIPVITVKDPLMEEYAGDAVLYADWTDPASISKHMITLYKNEDLSNSLVAKAKERVAALSWQRSLDELYNHLIALAEH
ncbi:MAG: glycosyltransferase, partial [Chitinophagaceae bacterium]